MIEYTIPVSCCGYPKTVLVLGKDSYWFSEDFSTGTKFATMGEAYKMIKKLCKDGCPRKNLRVIN